MGTAGGRAGSAGPGRVRALGGREALSEGAPRRVTLLPGAGQRDALAQLRRATGQLCDWDTRIEGKEFLQKEDVSEDLESKA